MTFPPPPAAPNSAALDPADKDRLLWALGERVKELTALHGTARILQDGDRDPRSLLAEVAALIPPAWQYPESTVVRIAVGGAEAASPRFRPTPWMQTAELSTRDGRPGLIEVAYLEEKPSAFEGPFLAEERALVRSLAQMLQSHFDRRAAAEDLRRAYDDLDRQVRERTAELSRANSSLQCFASQLALAEERERRAIASGLHDHIGQALAVVKGRLGRLQGNAVFSGMEADLEEARTLLDQVIHATRTLTFEISPPVLYELGLEAALEWLAKQFKVKHGLKVEVASSGTAIAVPDDLQITLFRSVQELLLNAVKYAQASAVKVNLTWREDRLSVEVRDDGVGFDPVRVEACAADGGGFGLFSIRERLKALGGALIVESSPGHGAVFAITVPVSGRKEEPPCA